MHALIMILLNTITQRYHPIYYLEKPLPGPDSENTIRRYKSKGHHTTGFATHEEALASARELTPKLKDQGYIVHEELEGVLPWTDEDMPIDTQLRPM